MFNILTMKWPHEFQEEILQKQGNLCISDETLVFMTTQFKQGMPAVPPGYGPEDAAKPRTKAAKKNEKRKEKKQQVPFV